MRSSVSRVVEPDGAAQAQWQEDAAARVLHTGVALAAAAVATQSVAHLVDLWAFDLEVEVIRAESDTSAWAWASIVATFTAAVGAMLLHAVLPGRPVRHAVLAGAFAFLSLDDMIQVHERISGFVTDLGVPPEWHLARLFWTVVFLPLLATTFWLLWSLATTMPDRLRGYVFLGAGLLVLAIGLEAASPALFWVGFDHGDLAYELEVVLEEGAELGGWALIASSLLAYVVCRLESPSGPGATDSR